MFFIDGDWVGLTLPPDSVSTDDHMSISAHIQAVEARLNMRPPHRYLAYWSGRTNRQCLRHYFNRALSAPAADEILRDILEVACGENPMYDSRSWRAANMILAVLTHPYCAHIPVEDYPDLARSLLPTARQFHSASDCDQFAMTLQLAADLASKANDGAFGGAAARQSTADSEQDEPAPMGH